MSQSTRRYWFPAKRYGWGWGPPSTWEGWAFLVVWIAVFFASAPLAKGHPALFALFGAAMIAVMLAVCIAKGEPPRWRWGDRDKPSGD